ncbi:hypothetical protein KIL84_016246 [Mauremys mutica]|uniref:Interleukin-9 n=1 Tax=Mauremys mutica TaxID=74926 RepID=A0A9D3WSA8_9SAUR|nr:hypothetical protein KIL84_016246 [Mauremys mutica]
MEKGSLLQNSCKRRTHRTLPGFIQNADQACKKQLTPTHVPPPCCNCTNKGKAALSPEKFAHTPSPDERFSLGPCDTAESGKGTVMSEFCTHETEVRFKCLKEALTSFAAVVHCGTCRQDIFTALLLSTISCSPFCLLQKSSLTEGKSHSLCPSGLSPQTLCIGECCFVFAFMTGCELSCFVDGFKRMNETLQVGVDVRDTIRHVHRSLSLLQKKTCKNLLTCRGPCHTNSTGNIEKFLTLVKTTFQQVRKEKSGKK